MKKKILWACLSLLIAGLTILAVASQSRTFSLADLWALIRSAHKGWLIAALLAMFGFIFFEGMAIIRVTRRLGYPKSPDGIPAATATVTLLITLVMYTLALLLSGIVTMVFFFPVFAAFTPLAKTMILLGSAVLLALGIFFLMLLVKPAILHRICGAFLTFLEKIHLMRGAKRLREKLAGVMEEYALCSKMLLGKGHVMAESFFWNLCQRLSYFLVTFLLFMAVGKGSAMALKATSVQCLACVGSNCIPIPGAMGAADYMLLDGFSQLLSHENAVTMEMLCRGVAFYCSVSVGLVIVIIGYFAGRKRKTGRNTT